MKGISLLFLTRYALHIAYEGQFQHVSHSICSSYHLNCSDPTSVGPREYAMKKYFTKTKPPGCVGPGGFYVLASMCIHCRLSVLYFRKKAQALACLFTKLSQLERWFYLSPFTFKPSFNSSLELSHISWLWFCKKSANNFLDLSSIKSTII